MEVKLGPMEGYALTIRGYSSLLKERRENTATTWLTSNLCRLSDGWKTTLGAATVLWKTTISTMNMSEFTRAKERPTAPKGTAQSKVI